MLPYPVTLKSIKLIFIYFTSTIKILINIIKVKAYDFCVNKYNIIIVSILLIYKTYYH